jgi:thioredoxin-related protein
MKKFLLILSAVLTLPALAADFPKGSPKFGTDYQTALATAKKENKPVVLVFSAPWCGPCQTMKTEVYPSKEVAALHDQFVWAYLDVDEDANLVPSRKFRVESIPYIHFLSADGKDLGSQTGSVPSAEFAGILKKVLSKAKP